jgi:hypothetical protein
MMPGVAGLVPGLANNVPRLGSENTCLPPAGRTRSSSRPLAADRAAWEFDAALGALESATLWLLLAWLPHPTPAATQATASPPSSAGTAARRPPMNPGAERFAKSLPRVDPLSHSAGSPGRGWPRPIAQKLVTFRETG